MRLAVIGTVLLGLLLAADETYLGAARSLSAYDRYRELRLKETTIIQAEGTRRLTTEELKTRTDASGELSQVHSHLGDWQAGSFLALGFLGCGVIWLGVITATPRATEPGSLLHRVLKGSLIGSIVIGTCFTCLFGFVFWIAGEGRRTADRYEWEVRWLIGAIGGAIVGALFGLLAGVVLKRFRRNQISAKAAVG
jgi:hypothetical protein